MAACRLVLLYNLTKFWLSSSTEVWDCCVVACRLCLVNNLTKFWLSSSTEVREWLCCRK